MLLPKYMYMALYRPYAMAQSLPDDFENWPIQAQGAYLRNKSSKEINKMLLSELRLEAPSGDKGGLTKYDRVNMLIEIIN